MTDFSAAAKLDPRAQHVRIPGPRGGSSVFLRFLPAAHSGIEPRRTVLYVHGATFPSALSTAHRFDGKSWRDALGEAGLDVWGLDFYGFGHSDRYPERDQPPTANPALCVAGCGPTVGGRHSVHPGAPEPRKAVADLPLMGLDARRPVRRHPVGADRSLGAVRADRTPRTAALRGACFVSGMADR